MDQLTDFNLRILNTPEEWKQPLIDIIDTMSAISVGIRSEPGIINPALECPDLLLGLTKMVIERHDLEGVNYISPRELK